MCARLLLKIGWFDMKMDGKWNNTIIAIIVIAIAAIMFPLILDGSDEILRESQTDISTNIVAAAGSGTVPLSQPLYDGDVTFVTSVASSSGTDTPVASTWSSDVLTVTGLTWAAPATRTLTTTYQYDQTDDYTGLSEIVEVAPMMIWIGIIMGFGFVALFTVRAVRKKE